MKIPESDHNPADLGTQPTSFVAPNLARRLDFQLMPSENFGLEDREDASVGRGRERDPRLAVIYNTKQLLIRCKHQENRAFVGSRSADR